MGLSKPELICDQRVTSPCVGILRLGQLLQHGCRLLAWNYYVLTIATPLTSCPVINGEPGTGLSTSLWSFTLKAERPLLPEVATKRNPRVAPTASPCGAPCTLNGGQRRPSFRRQSAASPWCCSQFVWLLVAEAQRGLPPHVGTHKTSRTIPRTPSGRIDQ
jgi:hypothetical protein